ncbi:MULTISPECIES: hypothetical protein [Cryobacterium]|uniref:Uncharacterized protein n=1 Tax=Cryobacterium breve TaxID=1259258 RepID=A0ABY2IXU2_9MICO|nr:MULTISPECIES: hypothetical protein [Cryobacterium]TFC94425.1 hypothetical protein E3T20_07955 [Cryobacterium sp. TmT3-12]TFC95029.1 hypothetical protein E3O65_15845 [Cryobacterium breve]
MRMATASGRSRWPIVIGVAALVVAISGGIAYTATRRAPNAAPNTATATPTPTPTSTAGAGGIGDDVAPTGCLGGQDRNVSMVLTAQTDAKHTSYGAVEAATAYYRWLWQYPNPAANVADADTVSAAIMASTANDSFRDIAAAYEATAGIDMTSGQVPADTPFHLSTTNGLWMISEGSTADKVEVNIAAGYVVNGELSPTKAAVMTQTMVWEDGTWHLESAGTPDQSKLAAGGTRYTAGC